MVDGGIYHGPNGANARFLALQDLCADGVSLKGLADGNNTVEIQGQDRGDEIGQMARALDVFRDALVEMQALEKKKAEGRDAELNQMVEHLSRVLSQLSDGNLMVQIEEQFPEGYEKLRGDFNQTVITLKSIVGDVMATSSSIGNGAVEISQAPMVSITHFMSRDGQFLASVSPRRFFCTQCHVTQTDAKPLIANTFVDVDSVLGGIANRASKR